MRLLKAHYTTRQIFPSLKDRLHTHPLKIFEAIKVWPGKNFGNLRRLLHKGLQKDFLLPMNRFYIFPNYFPQVLKKHVERYISNLNWQELLPYTLNALSTVQEPGYDNQGNLKCLYILLYNRIQP